MTNATPTHGATDLTVYIVRMELHRWIGKCGACSAAVRVEGRNAGARFSDRPSHVDAVVSMDGAVFSCADLGSNPTRVLCTCVCGARAAADRVYEGRKASKHKCGAKCRSAKGPACDCLCGGEFHGAG